jgi:hypothetical protein
MKLSADARCMATVELEVGRIHEMFAPMLAGGDVLFLRLPSHCGLSFRLRDVAAGQVSSFQQLPDSIVVNEVLAIGCDSRGRVAPR